MSTFRRVIRYSYWAPIAIFVASNTYNVTIISGRSMQPTFNPDSSARRRDIVLCDKWSIVALQKYKRGDIVTFQSPDDAKRILVKRIIGLEGDTVKTLPPYPVPEILIPKGHAWLEGDETFRSDDSNLYGPIPLALISSKVVGVVWPLSRFMIQDSMGGPNRRVTSAKSS